MENETKKLNPGPLGLIGFGLATILLNIHNLGLIDVSNAIIGLGFALGGLVQMIAGFYEFKNKNTVVGTAFIAFGGFWFSLVLIWLLPGEVTSATMGYFNLIWLFVGLIFLFAVLKENLITRLVFSGLVSLFFLLMLANFVGFDWISITAGVVGIITGLLALYNAAGQIIHEVYGRKILPLF